MKSKFEPPLAPGQVMKRPPRPYQAHKDRFLQEDVAAIIEERAHEDDAAQTAKDIITMVRTKVLQEIESYARQNIR